jgi:hypothetical protein
MPLGHGHWISPDGVVYEVFEHLMFVRERPELFGIAPEAAERMSLSPAERQRVLSKVILSGWTRVRETPNEIVFETDELTPTRIADIQTFLRKKKIPRDQVVTLNELKYGARVRDRVGVILKEKMMEYARNPRRRRRR